MYLKEGLKLKSVNSQSQLRSERLIFQMKKKITLIQSTVMLDELTLMMIPNGHVKYQSTKCSKFYLQLHKLHNCMFKQ